MTMPTDSHARALHALPAGAFPSNALDRPARRRSTGGSHPTQSARLRLRAARHGSIGRFAWLGCATALSTVAILALSACAHQPDAQTLARAMPGGEAALQAGAERAVLDASAFDAARQRTPVPARAPEPAPVAVAKPAAPEPRRLSVPFAQGSARLGTEQAAALQQLGRSAERGLRWRVTARVEAAGSPAGNRRLARARADRVIDQMVRAGIEREAIALVEVQASAAEAGHPQQSRRVDIESVEG